MSGNRPRGRTRRRNGRIRPRPRGCQIEHLEERTLLSASETPPVVQQVTVSSDAWTPSFLSHLEAEQLGTGGYAIPPGAAQLRPIPWSNVNQIRFRFNEDVSIAESDLKTKGINFPQGFPLKPGGFNYDNQSHTATWTFQDPLQLDKMVLTLKDDNIQDVDGNPLDGELAGGVLSASSGDGTAGGDFRFRTNVAPGDANQNQLVAADDALTVIGRVISLPGFPAYSALSDISGNGLIAAEDALLTINRIISFLPPGDFDLNPPQLTAALRDDTGSSQVDALTFDATIAGTVGDFESGLSLLTASVDGNTPIGVSFDESGNFTFDPGLPTDGTADGEHTVRFEAADAEDNESFVDLIFTLDTVPPTQAPTLELDPEFDSEPAGDGATTTGLVALRGMTVPDTRIKLLEADRQTTADENGDFEFPGISLLLGENPLTAQVQVFDDAGNAAQTSVAVTRTASSDSTLLTEGDQFVVEATQLVELGQADGTRSVRFAVDARFDFSDQKSAVEDIFAVYLVDPEDLGQTLLDRGMPGTAVFSLAGEHAEFVPGLVRYDGSEVEIDVTGLGALTQGQLLFQLINSDCDTGTQVAVGPVSSTVDEEGEPVPHFPLLISPASNPGAAIDLLELAPTGDLELIATNPRLDSASGRYTAELSLVNNGADVGRRAAVVFNNLPGEIQLAEPSGFDGNGNPYLNFQQAIPPGGLMSGASSLPIEVNFDNPSLVRFQLLPTMLSGGPNRPPTLEAISPLAVMPGTTLEVPVAASDADGDPITLLISGEGPLPTLELTAEGVLRLMPTPNELGSFSLTLVATDGAAEVAAEVTVDVVPDDVTTTRISGQVLDTNEQPLAGIPVELDGTTTTTAADGTFTLDLGNGPLPGDTLIIRGEQFPGPEVYPFIAEKLELLLGREVFDGVNNILDRPIYLPALDVAGGATIDPGQDTIVMQEIAPGEMASVFVQAGALLDTEGNPFEGLLSVTEVPRDRTPAALPDNLIPDTVVTIQPGEMVFTQPAPLTLPNRAGFNPGVVFDLWSISPISGAFEIVGMGQVSADGQSIETIEGGIRNSSWHMFAVQLGDAQFGDDVRNLDLGCNECPLASAPTNSRTELHSGHLTESHALASYQSLGTARGVGLFYDSSRIPHTKVFWFNYPETKGQSVLTGSGDFELRLIAEIRLKQGNVSFQAGRREVVLAAANQGGGTVAVGPGQPLSVGLPLFLSSLSSGYYTAELTTRVVSVFNGQVASGAGPASVQTWDFVHVNSNNSEFGAGWGVVGLQRVFQKGGGPAVLVDGNGSELVFLPRIGGVFESPRGDFSTFQQWPDGSYRRTMTDKTIYEFDSSGRLRSMSDRNGNVTTYDYDTDGKLLSIRDPVNLVTTFNYSKGRVSSIEDPAGRITQLFHDDAGDLRTIIDPDASDRTFFYQFHRMTGEIDKRGLIEGTRYNARGQVTQSVRRDRTVLNVSPLQSQPTLISGDVAKSAAFFADANGNVTQYELDQEGQVVSTRDGDGPGFRIERNEDNLVTQRIDPRRFETRFEYDSRGNVILIDDVQPVLTPGPIEIVDSDWSLTQQHTFSSNAHSAAAHYSPFDDRIYFLRKGGAGSQRGLFRVDREGDVQKIVSIDGPNTLVVDPIDGDRFYSELVFSDRIYRVAVNGLRQEWVSQFDSGSDTPMGMDIATADRTGGFLTAGQALVVDRGSATGQEEVWRFSTASSEGEVKVHVDDGTLVDPVDIAIARDAVYLVDTGDEDGLARTGAIYELKQDGSLAELVTSEPLEDPLAITFDPVTESLMVLDQFAGRVVSVDPTTGEVEELFVGFSTTGENWAGLDMTPNGGEIIVTDHEANAIYVFKRGIRPGGRRTFTYDPSFSQLTSITDELGRQTLFDVDPANGNVQSTTEVVGLLDAASGETDDVHTQFTYTSQGLVDTTTDPLNRVTDYDYDSLGRLTTITFAVGTADEAVQSFEYDLAGNATAIIDENGNRTEFDYDELNRLSRIVEADPDGAGPLTAPTTSFEYDGNGNVVRTTDAQNHVTESKYDAMDRLSSVRDEQFNLTRFTYDTGGNLLQTIDPLGQATSNKYDPRNRLISTIDPDGGVTRFAYDVANNLTSLIDPVGNATRFVYDFRNRVTGEIDPLDNESVYEYDKVDNLISKTDRNGRVTDFVYDDLDRLTLERWLNPDATVANEVVYQYDKASNLLAVDDAFSALAFMYDNRDRVEAVDNAGTPGAPNVVVAYAYDDLGNVLTVTDTIGGTAGASTEYQYDALNRTTRITQTGNEVSEKRVDFTYNPLGQYESIDRFSDLAGTLPVVATTYAYDNLNRLADIRHNNGTESVAYYEYTYDADSRITSIRDIDGLTTYTYDDRDQLTGADHTNALNRDETYQYDVNGNRVDSHLHGDGYATGLGNRLLSEGKYTYEYDDEGNMIRRSDIASGGARQFEWDHRNRLAAVVDLDSGGQEIQRVGFVYDDLDRRVRKSVDMTPTTSEAEVVTYYVYDAEDVLLDFAGGDGTGSDAVVLVKRYLHGTRTDQVLAHDGQGSSNWLLADRVGTIHDVVNDTGTIANHIVYDAFGNDTLQSNPFGGTTRYLFTGREFDFETGLYYFRARYYQASIGRFITEDPIGFGGGDANTFRYAENRPVSNTDPTGLYVRQIQRAVNFGVLSIQVIFGIFLHSNERAINAAAFPNLGDTYFVLGPSTPRFNCFAETMDEFDKPIFVRTSNAGVFELADAHYGRIGYTREQSDTLDFSLEDGFDKVVVFVGRNPDTGRREVTHGSSQNRSTGWWESKLGPGPYILHPNPRQLNGPSYGQPAAIYRRPR